MNHRLSQSVRSTQVVWVCMALVLLWDCAVGSPSSLRSAQPGHKHHITKRSFHGLECKGVYDKSIFARLDRICEDCYNLFRDPEVHSLCRKGCFTTTFFRGCVETLQLQDQMEEIQSWVIQIRGGGSDL